MRAAMKLSLSRNGSSAFRRRFICQTSGKSFRSLLSDFDSASSGGAIDEESDSRRVRSSSASSYRPRMT